MGGYYAQYLALGLVVLLGSVFVVAGLHANRLLRPEAPGAEKLSAYECGVDPVGEGWAQVHIRYYVYAYLYVIFAVDAVYLFPWATIFDVAGYGATTLAEMFVFLGFLAVGLLYAWRRGVLTWT